MNVQHYRTVCLVGELRSIAAAARALGVDPSKVSRAVMAVEDHLKIRLFQRTTRHLSVTEAGAAYLKRIAPLIEELDAAGDDLGGAAGAPVGTLRMTGSVAFSQVCLLPHLPEFHRLYPQITLELLPSDANLDLQAEGVDIAIRLAPVPTGNYVTTRLMDTRYRVCAAPSYLAQHGTPAEPMALSERDCLLFALPDYRTAWKFRASDGQSQDVPVSGRTVISNALCLRAAAIAGMGPCLLADWLIREALATGELVDLFPDHECTATEFDTAAWFLYPDRRYLPRKVRCAIDFFRARVTGSAG